MICCGSWHSEPNTEVDYARIRYYETFGHHFPMAHVLSFKPERILAIINECIESGKPYNPPTDDGIY